MDFVLVLAGCIVVGVGAYWYYWNLKKQQKVAELLKVPEKKKRGR